MSKKGESKMKIKEKKKTYTRIILVLTCICKKKLKKILFIPTYYIHTYLKMALGDKRVLPSFLIILRKKIPFRKTQPLIVMFLNISILGLVHFASNYDIYDKH